MEDITKKINIVLKNISEKTMTDVIASQRRFEEVRKMGIISRNSYDVPLMLRLGRKVTDNTTRSRYPTKIAAYCNNPIIGK